MITRSICGRASKVVHFHNLHVGLFGYCEQLRTQHGRILCQQLISLKINCCSIIFLSGADQVKVCHDLTWILCCNISLNQSVYQAQPLYHVGAWLLVMCTQLQYVLRVVAHHSSLIPFSIHVFILILYSKIQYKHDANENLQTVHPVTNNIHRSSLCTESCPFWKSKLITQYWHSINFSIRISTRTNHYKIHSPTPQRWRHDRRRTRSRNRKSNQSHDTILQQIHPKHRHQILLRSIHPCRRHKRSRGT